MATKPNMWSTTSPGAAFSSTLRNGEYVNP